MKELTTKFMPKVNIDAINTHKNTEDKNESDNDDVIINLNKDDYREKKDEE